MSDTTSVPSASLSSSGFIAPSEQAILAGRWSDVNAALGGNANTTQLTTPQGQLVSSETAIIGDCNDQFLALANGVDPSYASGRMQDAIGRIYFITRIAATATTILCTCTGSAGTVIPAGSLVQDQAGYTYSASSSGTMSSSGTVDITFANTATGPIACQADTVSIYQSVTGWTGVTNAAGVLGRDVETRSEFELRRSQTVAVNSVGVNAAVLGAVLAVGGVTDAYAVDNPEATAQTIGGVSVAANSLYVVVSGGAASDIARAIISKKPPGCAYTGSTSVTVTDPNTAYAGTTAPSYTVKYDVAAGTPIYINVVITNSTTVPSDALTLIQAAVQAAFSGSDGGNRARIYGKLYALRYYAGIAALGDWAQVVEITIGTSANPTGFTVQMNINEIPSLDVSDVTLTLQ